MYRLYFRNSNILDNIEIKSKANAIKVLENTVNDNLSSIQ